MIKKILVIDDNRDMRENMAEILENAGYAIIQASTGEEGIYLVKAHLPDLVLCDVMMPGSDGYKVLHTVRQHRSTSHIPFVFITGDNSSSGKCKGLNAGVDDYLIKPFDHKELLAIVGRRINDRLNHTSRIEQQLRMHIDALEEILSTISHDMRNPICSSIGLTSLLEQGKVKEKELKTVIDGLKSNATHLENITGKLTEAIHLVLTDYKQKISGADPC